MFPYWILFSLSVAGAIQNKARFRRIGSASVLLVVFACIIALMIGLRYRVGGDWDAYSWFFRDIRHLAAGDALAQGDPGYSLLNWVFAQMGLSITAVNLVCGAIFCWGLVRIISLQLNPWLALAVAIPYLVIVVAMGYTRQAVAIGFVMAGLAALRSKPSLVRFGFYVLAAALFHRTAIVVLPLVALAATQNRWLMILFSGLLATMLFYFFVNAHLDLLVEGYVNQEYNARGATIRIVMNVLPAILFLLFQRNFSLDEGERRLWRNFAWAALVTLVMLMVLPSSVVVDRLALYLIPLQLVVFSRLPYAFGTKASTLLTLAVVTYSAAVQMVWLVAADNAIFWVPYRMTIV